MTELTLILLQLIFSYLPPFLSI